MQQSTVVLLVEWSRAGEFYNPGDVITLPAVEAENLVAARLAEYDNTRQSRVMEAPERAAYVAQPLRVARYSK